MPVESKEGVEGVVMEKGHPVIVSHLSVTVETANRDVKNEKKARGMERNGKNKIGEIYGKGRGMMGVIMTVCS